MASSYWIKLYHEILDDPKMGQLPDRAWRRALELFLMAGEENNEGSLPSTGDIAWRLRVPEQELAEDLELLKQAGILAENGDKWHVINFSNRQAASTSAERQQRYRDRQVKEQYYNGDKTKPSEGNDESVTNGNEESNEIVTERNADTDTEEIQKRTESEEKQILSVGNPPTSKPPPLTDGQRHFLSEFSAKRFSNRAQRRAVLELEQKYPEHFRAAVTWIAKKGRSRGDSIAALETALPKWGKDKTDGRDHRRRPQNLGPGQEPGYTLPKSTPEQDAADRAALAKLPPRKRHVVPRLSGSGLVEE